MRKLITWYSWLGTLYLQQEQELELELDQKQVEEQAETCQRSKCDLSKQSQFNIQEVQVEVLLDLSLSLFLFLFLYLYLVVEEGEVQPAAEPNEQEDEDSEEQVEPEKDCHCSHFAGAVVEVAVQAEACASYGHDVECDGGQGYLVFVGHVPFAVQQFGCVEECLVVIPWKMNEWVGKGEEWHYIHDGPILLLLLFIYFFPKSTFTAAEMGDPCRKLWNQCQQWQLTVELLPMKEGEATENPPAQSPCTLCPERGPKSNWQTPFLLKKEKPGR
jgi:hypothetical protein